MATRRKRYGNHARRRHTCTCAGPTYLHNIALHQPAVTCHTNLSYVQVLALETLVGSGHNADLRRKLPNQLVVVSAENEQRRCAEPSPSRYLAHGSQPAVPDAGSARRSSFKGADSEFSRRFLLAWQLRFGPWLTTSRGIQS